MGDVREGLSIQKSASVINQLILFGGKKCSSYLSARKLPKCGTIPLTICATTVQIN